LTPSACSLFLNTKILVTNYSGLKTQDSDFFSVIVTGTVASVSKKQIRP